MSDSKYSIDDILREAARIKEGGSFQYQKEGAPSVQAAPTPHEPEKRLTPPASTEKTAQRPKVIIRRGAAVKKATPAFPSSQSTQAARPNPAAGQEVIPPSRPQEEIKPVEPPANYPKEDYASRIAREVFSSNAHSKTQEIPLASIRRSQSTGPIPSVISPAQTDKTGSRARPFVYIPDKTAELPPIEEEKLFEPNIDLLKQIHEKRSEYDENRGRVEPRADYLPRHMAQPSFRTPDANAKEQTRQLDAETLKRMAAPAGQPDRPINSRTAKTQVIDPRELGAKPDFRFIKDVGTVQTRPQPKPAPQNGPLPKIEPKRNYAADFNHPPQKSAPRAPAVHNGRFTPPPPAHKQEEHFIRGSVIHKSERTDEILFTKTPPPIIEKPAIIRGETKFQKTADLQEIPEIMSVEDFKTKALHSPGQPPMPRLEEYDYSANQLKLDGVENEMEPPERIDEYAAEEQLYERRQEKVSHFKLFRPHQQEEAEEQNYFEFGEEEEPDLEPIDDYNSPKDKESILESFAAKERKLSIRTVATGALTILMLFFHILEAMNIVPAMLSDTYTMLTLTTVMLALVFLFNINTVFNGLRGLFRFRPDADFPITAASLFVMAQTVYAYFTTDLITEGLPVYSMALAFAFLCNDIGKQVLLRRVHANFDFLVSGGDKYTVQDIEDQRDTLAMCQGLLMGEPLVKHSVRTEFATNFLEIAYRQEPADTFSRRIAPFTVLISVAIGAAAYFMNKNIPLAISAATCAACVSVPVVSLLATNSALLSMSKKIKANGAMVNGFHGAQQMRDANAIVFDAADLFPAGSCNLHGLKTFGGMRVDDAILQTAAVIINTRGPLQDVFDKVIVGKQSILPEVEDLVYEERMGTSGWIYGKKILVGNRQLLINHGVKVPPEEFEAKYRHEDDRYLLYLTVAGRIAAMFVVSYQANAKVKEELQRLEKSGMTVLVRTSDPNINEDMLTRQYDLDEGFVRVLSSASGRIYEKYSGSSAAAYPAYIVHNGTAPAFISAMYASDVLGGVKNMLSIVQVFGCVLGLGLTAVFALFGGLSQMGSLSVVLFQCVWSALVLLLSKYKK